MPRPLTTPILPLAAALLAPTAVRAQETIPAPADASLGPDTVFVQELTWTEVAARVRAGTRSVIVPTGGTEQNGPHMVLGKHNFIIREASDRIARELGDTLVAPGRRLRPGGRNRSADRPHALRRRHHPFPRSTSRRSSNTRRAASRSTGSTTSSL